jgi:hypothetical protein
MCYCVYIGVNEVLQEEEFVPNETTLYFEKPQEEDLQLLRDKFSQPHIYYVGSETKCSCGFDFSSAFYHQPEWVSKKSSPERLLDFIKDWTKKEDLEFYCCWAGGQETKPEEFSEMDAGTIFLEKNYFGLTEGQFIKFIKNKE